MVRKRFMHPDRKAKRKARRQKIGRGIKKIASNPVVQKAVLTGANTLLSGGKLSKQNLANAALAGLGSTKKGSTAIKVGQAIKGLI
jgi:hypothetical protein